MSTTRISLTDSGIMLTFVRIRSSSSTAVERGRKETSIGRSRASSSLTSCSTFGPNPSGSGSNSKSIRALSGSMLPPVTGTRHSFQMTPHSTCSAEWVRISAVTPLPVDRAVHALADCRQPTRRRLEVVPRRSRRRSLRTSTTERPAMRAGVVGLASTGRVERGAVEGDRGGAVVAWSHCDHVGIELGQVGIAQVEQVVLPFPDSARLLHSPLVVEQR